MLDRFGQQKDQRDTRPLLRQALLCSSTTNNAGGGEGHLDGGRASGKAKLSGSGRYSGYGSCSNRSSTVTISSSTTPVAQLIPCSASTGDLDKLNTALEEVTGQQTPVKVLSRRRSVSLLNLTPPGRSAYYVPDGASSDSPPARILPPTEMFLDDTLLDGNLADILFSVEALWPRK